MKNICSQQNTTEIWKHANGGMKYLSKCCNTEIQYVEEFKSKDGNTFSPYCTTCSSFCDCYIKNK